MADREILKSSLKKQPLDEIRSLKFAGDVLITLLNLKEKEK